MLSRLERILDELSPTGDPSITEVAETFGVSTPTIRKWIREGLLDPGEQAPTSRVSFDSVARLDEALEQVRETLPARVSHQGVGKLPPRPRTPGNFVGQGRH
jgi:DNA-binding transcriptional MerR regulator